MGNKLDDVFKIVNGIEYTRGIPKEAEDIAKQNNIIVIVGGSDDLMYAYGADSYLTDYCEHDYGWDGDTLQNINDKNLEREAEQLGLMIYWCGSIIGTKYKKDGYDVDKQGAFSYSVKDGVEYKDFIVYEDDKKEEVYCTGIIIKLPDNFKSYKEEE